MHLNLMQMLIIRGALPPLHCAPSCLVSQSQRVFYLYFNHVFSDQ